MSRVAIASINIDALKHNVSVVKKAAPNSKILAVVKANAYGHGLLEITNALQDVDGFAVAHFEEAVKVREAHPEKVVVLLQGFSDEIELTLLLSQNIQPVIHSSFQIDLLEKVAAQNPSEKFSIWLKIDTGMHRLGIMPKDVQSAWQRLTGLTNFSGNIKVMSHLANADKVAHPNNDVQFELFQNLTEDIPAEKSLSNSAGLLAKKKYHFDWVRPGIMLYGASPFTYGSAEDNDLKPVMRLTSRIIAINGIKKGETVGYGSCWTPEKDTTIVVVGIGYGDGYPRQLEENTPVLISGNRFPIVGRVSMDMICVDVGETNNFAIGDEVLLWGEGLPVDEIAEKASTIAYELLCRVTARVKYQYENSIVDE